MSVLTCPCSLACLYVLQPLAKSLGVRVVPTFKLFKNKEIIAEVVGAKYDELLAGLLFCCLCGCYARNAYCCDTSMRS